MDRREALRRMAIGGATFVGASTVLSGVAFADGGTVGSRPTAGSLTISSLVVANSQQKFTFTANIGSASCPKGTLATARLDTQWSVVTFGGVVLPPITAVALAPTRTTYTPNSGTSPVSLAQSIDVTPSGREANTKYAAGDTVTIQIDARWVCRGAVSGAVWTCSSWQFTVLLAGSGNSMTASVSSGPTAVSSPAACNVGVTMP